MSILSVNLKHLYQRRSLWLMYAFFGLILFLTLAVPSDRPSAGKEHFMGLIMLEFMIGLCTASSAIEILTKPFSYCLPGHRRVLRKFVFWGGAVTSLPGSLVFLAYHHLHWWQWAPVTCCAAFCTGLIMYWVGVGLAFGVRNSDSIAGFAFLLPIFVLFSDQLFHLHAVAERAIIGHPFAIALLGLASSAAVWIWLGSYSWARRFCAIPGIGLFGIWDQDRLLEYERRRAAVECDKSGYNLDPWVERFFLDRMNKCDALGSGRYIWGGLYTTYGVELSQWKESLSQWKGSLSGWLQALVLAIFLSYLGHGSTDAFFPLIAGPLAAFIPLPIYSNMMISGGRNERFINMLVLAGTVTAIFTAAMVFLSAMSIAVAPIMPDFTFRGLNGTFHTMSLRLLVVPSIVIPIVFAFRLIIFKKPFSTLASIILVIALMFAFGINSFERLSTLINPTSLLSLLILGWLILALVLRHICMRRSLAGQGRTY